MPRTSVKPYFESLIYFVILLFLPFLFQNCSNVKISVTEQAGLNLDADYIPNEVIIKADNLDAHHLLKDWAKNHGLQLIFESENILISHWRWDLDYTVEEVIEAVYDQDFGLQIEFAEPNYNAPLPKQSDVNIFATLSGSDQQSFDITSRSIGTDKVWSQLSTPVKRPVVAIIDSGLDLTHELIVSSNSVWVNMGEIPGNGIDDDNNGYIDDVNGWNFHGGNNDLSDAVGHGTQCAGITIGVSFDMRIPNEPSKIEIMPLKFITAKSGDSGRAIAAVVYAAENGANVINTSWGGYSKSKALFEALKYASNMGAVLVAAAGNDTNDNDIDPTYPANFEIPNMISVISNTDYNDIAYFSNYGMQTMHLAANGVEIFTTYPESLGDKYISASGTSMSAPLVSGAAALVLIESPSMTGYQVKQTIIENSDYQVELAKYTNTGKVINFEAIVQDSKTVAVTGEQPKVSAKLTSKNGSDEASACGQVIYPGSPTPPPWQLYILVLPMMILLLLKSSINRQKNNSYSSHGFF